MGTMGCWSTTSTLLQIPSSTFTSNSKPQNMKRYCVDGSSIATSLTSFDDTSRFEESSDMTGRYSIRSNTNANSLSSPLSLLSSSSDQTVPDNYGCTSTAAKSMYKDNHQGPHVDVEVMG